MLELALLGGGGTLVLWLAFAELWPKNDPDSLIHSLTASDAHRLIAEGAIETGMIPKVEACLETLQKGVRKIHIIDGRIRHSLMLEIYTNRGIGTEIVAA